MKLPLAWLMDYLPADLRGPAFTGALARACSRFDIDAAANDAETLGKLMTFSGFNCDGVEDSAHGPVLLLDVLSNRPDCQCVLGLAREAAAILQVPLLAPNCDTAGKESGDHASTLARVSVEEPELCPRYTARVIRGVKVGPSPKWLTDHLLSLGLTPRNNIVDVTNFILFELNQPLHAFDLKGLAGRQIVVRRARDKEAFEPLYGTVPPLTPETLVIADAEKPRAIAGVLGGKGSEVTPGTTEILLESAYFNPANTRRTVRRLKVMDGRGTDSSYRFERGIDLENVERASARAARLIVEVAGGSIAPGVIDVFHAPPQPVAVCVEMQHVKRVFGSEIPCAEALKILELIGCNSLAKNDARGEILEAKIPSWRRGDLAREIDLIEEIARLHGFNRIPETTAMAARVAPRSPPEIVGGKLRELFAALGYFEAVTDSLIDPRWPAPAVWTHEKPLALDAGSVLRGDHSALRNSLLASLLAVRRHNQNQRTGVARMFEIGTVFLPAKTPRPQEKRVLCLIDDLGFRALSDALLRLNDRLELDGAHLKFSRPLGNAPEFLHPEESCRVLRVRELPGNERAEDMLGWIGTLGAGLQTAFELRKPLAVCELDFNALASLPRAPLRYAPLPEFPENSRDVALVVDEAVTWSEIESFARCWQAHDALRDKNEPPRFLSAFRGKQLGAGKKSVAFSLMYRAGTRTLSDEEVNAAHASFQAALLEKFKGALRA